MDREEVQKLRNLETDLHHARVWAAYWHAEALPHELVPMREPVRRAATDGWDGMKTDIDAKLARSRDWPKTS